MRAFLSHSSVDKELVIAVQHALDPSATWLDRAEIEWGQLFVERIADGIIASTDFVLFWSAAAAKSEWVRLEINMAFIQALRHKAIRFRIIVLDKTPLPLQLQPFHFFDATEIANRADRIIERLRSALTEPVRSARSRFINRNEEINKIEAAIDDPLFHAVLAFGFTGVGKVALVKEALRRLFEGAGIVHIDVDQGTGPVELALALNALVRKESLAESLNEARVGNEIRLSIEVLAKNGQLLLLSNVQHWLDEDGRPKGPLPMVLSIVARTSAFSARPAFFTSTRRPSLDGVEVERLMLMKVSGLKDEHMAALVRNWFFSIYEQELSMDDAQKIAPQLFGHPMAARLAAGILGDHSADFLSEYPRELIALRRDLARVMLQGLKLAPFAERLMETLALAGTPLPPQIIVASGLSEEDFQDAVSQCASAGLLSGGTEIEAHPLFQEFYWHRLHRSDFKGVALSIANALKQYVLGIKGPSPTVARLLPVAFRLFALSGNLSSALDLRKDLSGELEAAAIVLYNRRDYTLADRYIGLVLEQSPENWRMRLYRARVRIRQERWEDSEKQLALMLDERPNDVGVLHAMGWQKMRQEQYDDALRIFAKIIAKKEHLSSLRDTAECLHRLGRDPEALTFIKRAKAIESENPFVLDLESQILEDLGQLEEAYLAGLLAGGRDPLNARIQNRLGVIRVKQEQSGLAIKHFQNAIAQDSEFFSPLNSLVSAFLEINDVGAAEALLGQLESKTRTPGDRGLLEHTKARVLYARKDLDGSKMILQRELGASRNLEPNLGLLIRVECAIYDENRSRFPAIADVALESAVAALQRIEGINQQNKYLSGLREAVSHRLNRR